MQGSPIAKSIEGCAVRAAELTDLDACDRLCESVHGHDRSGELLDGIRQSSALVVEREGRVTGHACQRSAISVMLSVRQIGMYKRLLLRPPASAGLASWYRHAMQSFSGGVCRTACGGASHDIDDDGYIQGAFGRLSAVDLILGSFIETSHLLCCRCRDFQRRRFRR